MTRYAIYAVPGADAGAPPAAVRLRVAVESWYARADVRELTETPRRYGFHATLQAPFRLAAGRTPQQLGNWADAFAAARPPVMIPDIRPIVIGGFRALVPGGDSSALSELAADVVRGTAAFRAPLTAEDRARRRPERLSPRQRELLELWGYPYVLEEFRFHMTLTDALAADRAAAAASGGLTPSEVDRRIAAHFAGVTGTDAPLTAIAICVERYPGAPFETLSLHPFTQEARS